MGGGLLIVPAGGSDLVAEVRTDVLIMGPLSRCGEAGFFVANTAESVLGKVDCSVLTVKPEGFVTPVRAE